MKILDRYIGWSVAGSMLTVLFVLLALFSFGTFVAELDQTGRGDYTPLKAAQYVLLTLPRLAYQLFPMVALLGAILGLGVLASHNELTVMRAAGVATGRIVWAVMKVGLVLMVLAAALGEYLAPPAEDYARSLRAKALSQQVALTGTGGLWARDGRQYVHVRDVLAGGELGGVTIYRFAEDLRLVEVIRARRARYGELAWLLQDVSRNRISEEQVSSARLAQLVWPTVVTPELIGVVAVKPDSLSAAGLWRYVNYLQGNGLDARRYQAALWAKLMAPLTTGVMVFLAVPFIFGPLRSVGVGQRIFVGTLAGIVFHLVNQTFNYAGVVYHFNPVLTASLPTVLCLGVALYFLRRVR